MNLPKSMEEQNKFLKVLHYYALIFDVCSDRKKVICPFHADVNASMVIDIQNCIWYCFGCGKSGGVIKMICLMEPKLSELQACQKLFRILRSNKCKNIKKVTTKPVARDSVKQLDDEAHDYYFGLATVDWQKVNTLEEMEALRYLKSRGMTPKLLNRVRAKVTFRKNYGIIFPMLDNGGFKGWVCRTTIPEVEKKRKYLYNKGFGRSTTLVGNYTKMDDFVYVVEGFFDYAKFLKFGIENVVALLGWKATQNQIEKLKERGIKKIISVLDNDDCGERGTKFLESFFEVTRWRYLKSVKDPGEMTGAGFKRMLRLTIRDFES